MAIKVTGIGDCRAMLGPSQWLRAYELDGDNSYPTGGWPITATQVDLEFIFGAWIIAWNAASALYLSQFVQVAGAFGTTTAPQTSI